MPAYGFMPKFVAKCLDGTKPHTIRAIRKDNRTPKVGEPFIAYCGMRQPTCTWLFTSEIVKVQAIYMERSTDAYMPAWVWTAGESMKRDELHEFLKADGFGDAAGFVAHFLPSGTDTFRGHLIHWRPEDARAPRHHCPECGSRVRWSEIGRGFVCLCGETAQERFHRFKRPTA